MFTFLRWISKSCCCSADHHWLQPGGRSLRMCGTAGLQGERTGEETVTHYPNPLQLIPWTLSCVLLLPNANPVITPVVLRLSQFKVGFNSQRIMELCGIENTQWKTDAKIDFKMFVFFDYLHSLERWFMLLALNQFLSGTRATATIQVMTQSPCPLKERLKLFVFFITSQCKCSVFNFSWALSIKITRLDKACWLFVISWDHHGSCCIHC